MYGTFSRLFFDLARRPVSLIGCFKGINGLLSLSLMLFNEVLFAQHLRYLIEVVSINLSLINLLVED